MWGAKVKTPVDMPDDILKDAIDVATKELSKCEQFETSGTCQLNFVFFYLFSLVSKSRINCCIISWLFSKWRSDQEYQRLHG